jgi:hypothetical protein
MASRALKRPTKVDSGPSKKVRLLNTTNPLEFSDTIPYLNTPSLQSMPAEVLNMILAHLAPEYSFTIRSSWDMIANCMAIITDPGKSYRLSDLLLVSKHISSAVMRLISVEGLDLNIHVQNSGLRANLNKGDVVGPPMAVFEKRIKGTPLQYIRKIKIHLQPRLERSEKGFPRMYRGLVEFESAMILRGSCLVSKILEKMVAHGVVRHGCKIKVICYEINGLHAAALKPAQAPPMPVWNLMSVAAALGPWRWIFTEYPGLSEAKSCFALPNMAHVFPATADVGLELQEARRSYALLDTFLREDTFRRSSNRHPPFEHHAKHILWTWRQSYFGPHRCLLISSIADGPESSSATEIASLRSPIRSRLVKGPLKAAARVLRGSSSNATVDLWNVHQELCGEIQCHAIPVDITISEQKVAEFHRQMVLILVQQKASNQLMSGTANEAA